MSSNEYSNAQIKFIIDIRKEGLEYKKIAEKYNAKFKTDKSWEAMRKVVNRYADLDESDDAFIKNLKEKVAISKKNAVLAKQNLVILDSLNYIEEAKENIKSLVTSIKYHMHKPVKTKKLSVISRTIIAHMSDMHYGVNIEPKEVAGVNAYNWTIAAERTAFFCEQTATYKLEHRKETELVLLLNGDGIAGVIHGQEGKHIDLITTQISGSLHILTQAISYLASHYGKVRVVGTTGNHSRMMHKADKGRASQQKWDSFETIIYVGLKHALKSHTNVSFTVDEAPFTILEAQGHKFLITHSDTVFNVGNVSKSLNINSLKQKVNDYNVALAKADHISAVLVGHLHQPTVHQLDNGVFIFVNGCLSGVDPFCQSIGIGLTQSRAVQQIVEVTKDFAVGDMRFVQTDKGDGLKRLHSIVKPFEGNF